MSKKRSVCFISYSHEDIDRETIGYFKYLLEKYSQDEFDVLIDEDLPIAANLDDFMNLLKDKVDAVVILMTPSYKRKVIERAGGVYREYKIIIDRYQDVQSQMRRGKKSGEITGYLEILPILYAGRPEDSVLDEIRQLKYLDFTSFRAFRNKRGGYHVSEYVSKTFVPGIVQIVNTLGVIAILKSQSFDTLVKSYYPRLFLELKADWQNPRDRGRGYHETLFVKTKAYQQVEAQSAYFMIGRKGSGKTTLRDVLAIRQSERYFGHICINADEFKLEFLYSFLGNARIRSDVDRIFNRVECFKYAWDGFLMICCMQALVEARRHQTLSRRQRQYLLPIVSALNAMDANPTGGYVDWNARFVFCFNQVFAFIDDCIQGARVDERYFYMDILARFNRPRFLRYLLGQQAWDAYEHLLEVVNRRVLVSLDGFDSAFDEFRRHSLLIRQGYEERAQFEIDWLRALLQLVVDGSRGNGTANPIYRKAEYCITVPHDRFFEVITSERDSFKYQQRFRELRWSGIELCILLRKRLEEMVQFSTDKSRSPEDRLAQIFQEKLPHIPLNATFMFNGRQYQMALFHYVLRHTFWRPREILMYYAQIIAASEQMRHKGKHIDSEHLRGFVNSMTREVVQTEFVGELETTLFNVEEILARFAQAKQVLAFDEVQSLLAPIRFEWASPAIEAATINQKIAFLYDIGFFGVFADARQRNRLNLMTAHAFAFNEGAAPLDTVGPKGFQDYRFIIHPVFRQYLDLDTSGNELIMNYSWPYLHQVEAASRA